MFGFFKRKTRTKLTKEQLRWSRLWDLWAEDKMDSPCKEIMTYQRKMNNGGHDQYFQHVGETGSLKKEMAVLMQVLPPVLGKNLQEAYAAYLALEKDYEDEQALEILYHCDDVFLDKEQQIYLLLEPYAAKIEL